MLKTKLASCVLKRTMGCLSVALSPTGRSVLNKWNSGLYAWKQFKKGNISLTTDIYCLFKTVDFFPREKAFMAALLFQESKRSSNFLRFIILIAKVSIYNTFISTIMLTIFKLLTFE